LVCYDVLTKSLKRFFMSGCCFSVVVADVAVVTDVVVLVEGEINNFVFIGSV